MFMSFTDLAVLKKLLDAIKELVSDCNLDCNDTGNTPFRVFRLGSLTFLVFLHGEVRF